MRTFNGEFFSAALKIMYLLQSVLCQVDSVYIDDVACLNMILHLISSN